MTQETNDLPVSSPVQSVLDLFENELAELKFPDIDQAVLSEAAHAVYQHAETLARAEAAVAAARELLLESQEALLQKCHRAVAYARIYAEEDNALFDKLEGISLPRCSRNGRSAQLGPTSEAKPAVRRNARRQGQRPLFLEQQQPAPATVELESQAA